MVVQVVRSFSTSFRVRRTRIRLSVWIGSMTDPSRGLNWIQDWQPVAEPDQLAEVGGFSFDYDQPSYPLHTGQFIGTSKVHIRSVLPAAATVAEAGAGRRRRAGGSD